MYIGKVVLPIKPVKDGDDDKAHEIAGAQPEIQFLHADADHKFMVNNILKQEQGITYSLFSPEEEQPPAEEEAVELDEEGNPLPKVEKEKPEVLPRHLLVEEVVEEPKMHYYQVPRLGSYLAVKLEYDSCLSEEAFDAAVVDL